MKRVLVIGCGGAGKSTVAAALAERTGLPLVHMDRLFWRPGWVPTPQTEWVEKVVALMSEERWILDGHYGSTLKTRLAACDTAVFLDAPRFTCLRNVLVRRIKHLGRGRADVAPGCPERINLNFLFWIWTYPRRRRAKVLALLAEMRPDQRAVILRGRADAARFIESLGPNR